MFQLKYATENRLRTNIHPIIIRLAAFSPSNFTDRSVSASVTAAQTLIVKLRNSLIFSSISIYISLCMAEHTFLIVPDKSTHPLPTAIICETIIKMRRGTRATSPCQKLPR